MAKTLQSSPTFERPAHAGPGSAPDRRAGARDAARGAPRAARIVLRMLERIRHGSLALTLPDGGTLRFGQGQPAADLRLANWKVFAATMAKGDIGFAETFIDGDWQTDSIADLLTLLVANRGELEAAVYGSALGSLLYRLRHLFRRNSRAGSRRNIHAHYDLGNAFYALWLDPTMTYSSALFEGDAARPLAQAQVAKYRRILDALALPAGASVLEIGCGWGGFAEVAIEAGLRVRGLTLSTEQLAWARTRLAGAGDAAAFVLQDYRDERARHDGIVSIEMFEAVGEAYWPRYFETLARCLAPGGRAVVQTIVIDEALFDRYRRGTDFIQQYVFPGGMLPSTSAFERAARDAGLRVRERFAFGTDYARTLRLWREAFVARLHEVRAQGFDDRFVRTWLFYLAYCEAAFRMGNTDVVQFTLEHA
jgi:cyclopropane-fatty-acyl-phospholipid synthase